MSTIATGHAPEFHGCAGSACNRESPCFTPHPWSWTHDTCLFASAYMRANHLPRAASYGLSGEPAYYEAMEARLKAKLLAQENRQ